jgi:hypothetical protein
MANTTSHQALLLKQMAEDDATLVKALDAKIKNASQGYKRVRIREAHHCFTEERCKYFKGISANVLTNAVSVRAEHAGEAECLVCFSAPHRRIHEGRGF